MPKKTTKLRPAPTAEARIAWLLNFLQTDIATMRMGAYLDLSVDVTYYLLDPQVNIMQGASIHGDETDDLITARRLAEGEHKFDAAGIETPFRPNFIDGTSEIGKEQFAEEDVALIPRTTLIELQRWLRDGLFELHTKRVWTPFPDNRRPQFTLQALEDGSFLRAYGGPEVLPILKLSAIDLIVQWSPRLRRCKNDECGITFMPTHGHQHFHDPACSEIVRQRRHRNTPRDYTAEEARRAQRELDRKKATTTQKGRTR